MAADEEALFFFDDVEDGGEASELDQIGLENLKASEIEDAGENLELLDGVKGSVDR